MNTLPKNWLIAALVIHLLVAWFSVGHYHDDEYAQILNFTTAKTVIEMQSQLMWEYEAKVRSGFQPFIAYSISKFTNLIEIESPFLLAFIYRFITAIISLLASIVFIRSIANEFKSEKAFKWTSFFLLFSWLLVFTNVRFSSEGWACSFFLLAFGLYLSPSPLKKYRFILVGFFFGLAFLARYQMGFMLLGFGLWILFIDKLKLRDTVLILSAGSFALLLGTGFDFWLYGEPSLSSWNYFKWHLSGLAGGSISAALPEPWWFYIYYSAVQTIPPLTLLLPFTVVLFWIMFPKHPITWITIPFVLFHSYFGHKEMRYLFPVLPYASIMMAFVLYDLESRFSLLRKTFIKNIWSLIFWLTIILNTVLLILILSLPASKEVAIWQNCLSSFSKSDGAILAVLNKDGSYSDPAELNMDFYNANQLKIIAVQNEDELRNIIETNPDKEILYASRKKSRISQLNEAGIQNTLICQALPNWILKININNWTSRASMWRIWSVSEKL